MKHKAKRQSPTPFMPWQTGVFERFQEIRHKFPIPFLLLCKLMDITPEELLVDFIDNMSHGSWKRSGRGPAKEKIVDYFIAHGYGQHYYSEQEIREIFTEMDAMGMLFPQDGNTEVIDLYSNWRSKHWSYWFEKWFNTSRRKV